ncbi:MAG: hypothetical protein JWN71_930 [Xanthobacteraceae bacterium]|nr:hypothetical protein [Xanthobacteraceae bacterium]
MKTAVRRTAFLAATLALCPASTALAQTTVDAKAQPVLVLGGAVVAVLFVGLGQYLVRKGQHYRRMADATMSSWPMVQGTIVSATIRVRPGRDINGGDNTRYFPEIRYAYATAGVQRQGGVVRIGLDDIGYGIEAQARAHAARYVVGAKVPVWHDPDDAAVATLETGQVGGAGKIFAGLIFTLVGLGAAGFAVWAGFAAAS